jgi:alpha-ketoglutarate-dependent taurine dioxygenase
MTTNAAVAKLEGISVTGDVGEFVAHRTALGPDHVHIGPVAHLAAERIRLAALEWEHFTVRQVAPTLGAVVEGLDLSQPLSDDVFDELRRAWTDYKVLFFRNQVLSGEQHLAFARQFGELETHPFLPGNEELPELVRFAKDALTGGYENGWHHDVTWREVPSKGAILRSIEVPDTGGDTLFCDMAAAYEGLSDELKDRLEGMTAVHDFFQAFGHKVPDDKLAEMREQYPTVEHPVVIHHPISGRRLLYVNRYFTTHVVGVSAEESDALLVELYRQADVIEYHCRFHWEPNSIAMWDNLAVQHYASSDYWPDVRVMERASIVGVRPSF